jgi:hypothetical protein
MTVALATDCEAFLTAEGFRRVRGRNEYRSDQFTLRFEKRWATLSTRSRPVGQDPLVEALGRPGLWKPIVDSDGATWNFDLRVAEEHGLDGNVLDAEEEVHSTLVAMLGWALETADGHVPANLSAVGIPERDEIELAIPGGGLTIRSGSLVRQGELICDASRVALTVPILTDWASDLPAKRCEWLRLLLIDAQRRWRVARVGISDGASAEVRAEVDLTGAPHFLLPRLVQIGVDALRYLVEWLLTPAVFVSDPSNACELFDVCQCELNFPKGG